MKRGWQSACVIFLFIFAFFGYESWQLALRDAIGPGPGFFPFWLSILGSALALYLLASITANRNDVAAGTLEFDRGGTRDVIVMVVALTAAAVLINPLGFRLTLLALIVGLLIALGIRQWVAIALIGFAGSFGVYQLFSGILKVPLPIGALGI
jgi:putative tricarboxylic transport membrane protein